MKLHVMPWIAASLLALAFTTSHVLAAPISSDLSITGSVELSTTIGVSPFSDGNVTQQGNVSTTVGGSTSNDAFATTPGAVDGANDGTTSAASLTTGNLIATGDGVGWNTDLDALFQTGFNFNEGYDFIIDLGFNLSNNSLTDIFTITMQVDYSHTVDVDGLDAFAESKMDIELNNIDVRAPFSEVLSDSLFGDALNGQALGTFGDTVSDVGIFVFDVVLNPGDVATITGTHQWEGGVFASGFSNVDVNVDFTVADVACQGVCSVVPIPGAAILFASGLSVFGLFRRRGRLAGLINAKSSQQTDLN